MNLLHFVPRTYVRGYILVPLRGSRMTVLFHRGLDFCVLTQTLPSWALLLRPFEADVRFLSRESRSRPVSDSGVRRHGQREGEEERGAVA